MYTVEVSLELETSPEIAFDTLADHDAWPRWMPRSFKPVGPSVGTLEVGKAPRVRISGAPVASVLHVQVVQRPRQITWAGGRAGVLWGEHTFFFEPAGAGVRVRSVETWSGWLAPLLKPILAPGAARVGKAQLAGIRRGALERASAMQPR
jgi:hypothetical protein